MRFESTASPAGGRRLRQPAQTRNGNALVDLIAVTESFVTARFLDIKPAASAEVVSTWEKRKKAWNNSVQVNLSTFDRWSALMGFVEARNALQHGLGRLTQRQLDKHREQILAQIKAASIHLNGDLLVILADDVDRCGKISADFIAWLDAAAPIA